MPIYTDQVREELSNLPAATDSIKEFVTRARTESEPRFFLSLLDLDREIWNGKKFIQITYLRGLVIQEFAQFMSWVDLDITALNPEEKILMRRMQIMVYSQFWECLGVQRLFLSLARIASGKPYDPQLLLKKRRRDSYAVYRLARNLASRQSLMIAPFLSAVYRNQVRNAMAHSELFFGGPESGYISFLNCDNSRSYHIPSLKCETWDLMYERTRELVRAFFEMRREGMREFRQLLPYDFSLPEFDGPFRVVADPRGGFTFQR